MISAILCSCTQLDSTIVTKSVSSNQKTLPPPIAPQRTTPTKTSTATATIPQEPTSSQTNTITPSLTITPSNTPVVPKALPEQLPLPHTNIASPETHLFFNRPILDGNNYPVSHYRYGMTWDGLLAPHLGVDMANNQGTNVVAIGNGSIFYSGNDHIQKFGYRNDFYGNIIILKLDQQWNGRTLYALYAHLDNLLVEKDQQILTGQIIGTVGKSGAALAPHLHLEIRIDDPFDYMKTRNPELWYSPISGTGIVAGQIINKNGMFIPGHKINILCADKGIRWVETYWNEWTKPDDLISENFVFSDIPATQCTIESTLEGQTISKSIDINSKEITFIIIQHDSP
tara:strand:- start:5744 stop:6769 length:1026 start_codon:yes stop_codon:yes gene_type:complete